MLPTQGYDRFTPPPPATIPSQSPRLSYFISRSNATFVPLIPADELPYSVRLVGIPRAMKIEHSCGMSHVGTHAFTGQLFQLEPVDAAQHIIDRINTCRVKPGNPNQRPAASDPVLYRSEQGRPATRSPPRSEPPAFQELPVSATATTWRRIDDAASTKSQEIIDNILAQSTHSSPQRPETAVKISRTPSSSPKSSFEQKDKIYCSYWIRSGECDYTQQGCRYKHEMPDKATLASIGFRTVPRWWQEKVAIQLGQSAIPTVGPVMKPAEWLKQRRESQGSQDSQSDEESGSEHDSEAGDENGLADEDAALPSDLPQSETVLDPMDETDEKTVASEPKMIDKPPNKIVTPTPVTATIATINKPYRKLSDVDLIDLSPISPTSPTVTVSRKPNGTNTSDPIKPIEPCPAKTPPPSLPAAANKQATASLRKVFVPAGESTEFHVADARKHAQTQQAGQKSGQKGAFETRQGKVVSPNTGKASSPTPATIPKRSEPRSGLMASIHAPPSDRQKPSHSDILPGAKKLPRQPRLHGSNLLPEPKGADNGRAKGRTTISSDSSRFGSRTARPLVLTTRKAGTVDDKGGAPKLAQSSGTDSPKSVCCPRRPAARNSKAVVSRVVTGGTKE